MQQQVVSRWFRLADLILVSAAGAILYFWPQTGFWPLILAAPGWFARGLALRSLFKHPVIHLSMVLFLSTAAMGIWAAPLKEAAWAKFWILVGGALLFYALAEQPKENLWPIAWLFGLFGACLSISFILFQEWEVQATDFEVIRWVTSMLSGIRPALPVRMIQPNMVGGILAMLIPFPLALSLKGWKNRKRSLFLASTATGLTILAGLALTSSRGAWLALAIALASWSFLRIVPNISFPVSKSFQVLLTTGLVFAGVIFAWLAFSHWDRLAGLSERIPGMNTVESRSELAVSAIQLIGDFPFTGGGLKSFAGLYSQYIQVIPFFLFDYSHNLYLDVGLEQGVLGFATLMVVLLTSIWTTGSLLLGVQNTGEFQWLRRAVLAGLVVVCLHGFVDDALYGGRGTPLIFLLPGMAVALAQLELQAERQVLLHPQRGAARVLPERMQVWTWVTFAVLCILLASFTGGSRSMAAIWYANLGAVEMAQIELANWPTEDWAEGKDVSDFARTQVLFNRSLALDPDNRTANHRAGLIALRAQDFFTAQTFLERAFHTNPGHRGVRKVLGYSYAWSGQTRRAVALLKNISEAKHEMHNYTRWWKEQGRPDLANLAEQTARNLK